MKKFYKIIHDKNAKLKVIYNSAISTICKGRTWLQVTSVTSAITLAILWGRVFKKLNSCHVDNKSLVLLTRIPHEAFGFKRFFAALASLCY